MQDSKAPSGLNAAGEPDVHLPWFAGKTVDVLLYKINRRPPGTEAFLVDPPQDVIEHLMIVLDLARTVESGRRYKRTWRIGNKSFNREKGEVSGRLGWSRAEDALSSSWDEADQAWVEQLVASDTVATAPFVFVADGRFLGVLKHSSFSETTVSAVFRDFLNDGERARDVPTTDWDVEPIGDEEEFYEWLSDADRVTSVDFVFKRPNPDAEREFEELFARLDELEARQIRETVVARDQARGLNKQALRTEPVSRSFIAAAMAAFGYVVGRGFIGNRKVKYDQRKHGARERLENVSGSWDGALDEVRGAVYRAQEKRRGA